jgi:hypothetical protein
MWNRDGNYEKTAPININCAKLDNASPLDADCPSDGQTLARAPCGKFVKLFVHGTEVLSLIPHHFHHNVLKEFWPIYSLDLVF